MANSASSSNVVKTAIDHLLADENYRLYPGPEYGSVKDSEIFEQITPENGSFIEAPFGGGGYFVQTGEEQDPNKVSRRSGTEKVFTMNDYTQSEALPENFERDSSKHRAVAKILANMRKSAYKSMEAYGFEPFRDGFTGGSAQSQTYTGTAIFSNSHTLLDGSTLDNLITPALDADAIEAAIIQLTEMKDQDGVIGAYMPKCLLVPPALFREAVEVTESVLKPGTTDNDINYVSAKYGIMVKQSPFLGANAPTMGGLTAGSDSRWFLLSDETPFRNVMAEGLQMEVVDASVRDNFVSLAKAKFRQFTGATIPNGVVGSNGTT